MTLSDASSPAAPRAWRPLAPLQRRVLGVLVEKSKTTPAGYPMSVNAITVGCNQKNNRDPLMNVDDVDVSNTLVELQRLGVVTEIDWLGRVPKYKHLAYEWLGVDKVEMAVMTELLLRGAQALGELRGRAARMEPIADLAALKPVVAKLVARGLMIELTAPGRGQVVSHNLFLMPELTELRARHSGGAPEPGAGNAASPTRPPAVASGLLAVGPPADSVAALAEQITELREEVARLREHVRDLESRLGGG